MWGLLPLYWPLLKPATPLEIFAHRIVWSAVAVLAVVTAARRWRSLLNLWHNRRALLWLVFAAVVLAVNWTTFIYAVNTGHVVETSLGYFISPLISVLLGVFVLRERLRVLQWTAVVLAVLAMTALAVGYHGFPWLAVTLAVTFAVYGLAKKIAGIAAVESMAVEMIALLPPSVLYIAVLESTDRGTFADFGAGHMLWLASSGLMTLLPLLLFSAATTRMTLVSNGLLLYITPILQFLCGILILREPMSHARWFGFVLVWVAVCLAAADTLLTRPATIKGDEPDHEPAGTRH